MRSALQTLHVSLFEHMRCTLQTLVVYYFYYIMNNINLMLICPHM